MEHERHLSSLEPSLPSSSKVNDAGSAVASDQSTSHSALVRYRATHRPVPVRKTSSTLAFSGAASLREHQADYSHTCSTILAQRDILNSRRLSKNEVRESGLEQGNKYGVRRREGIEERVGIESLGKG